SPDFRSGPAFTEVWRLPLPVDLAVTKHEAVRVCRPMQSWSTEGEENCRDDTQGNEPAPDRGSGRGSLLLSGMGHLLIFQRARTVPEQGCHSSGDRRRESPGGGSCG